MIDLRSDTVTQPTQQMREAMFAAEVGDDVYRDDPTMNRLEQLAAEMLGKEAALFVPSGTMGNQLAVMTHTRRGEEVISSAISHVFSHEVGAAAVLSGVLLRTIPFEGGMPDPEKIAAAIRPDDIHEPPTSLILMENALANGRVVPISVMQEVYAIAQANNLKVHLDGARLFNAALALGVDAREITACCDSVMCCLSKGLCAPVGSILAGSREFIDRARKNRKMLGGGMRQVGFLAAAGILALTEMTKRLHEDHDNAKYLARQLSEIEGVSVDPASVEINMVFFRLDMPITQQKELPAFFEKQGILINGPDGGEMRFVTHYGVERSDIDKTIEVLKAALA